MLRALLLVCGLVGCDRLWSLSEVTLPSDSIADQTVSGCDADFASDDANCGSCGSACPEAHACQASACVPLTCKAILLAATDTLLDGVFSIDTDGRGAEPVRDVFCDMSSDGGGWALLITLRANTNTNNFFGPAIWNDDPLQLDRQPPMITGMFKGSLAPFSEVREEVSSGASTVYGRGLSPTQLETIRELYGFTSRTAAAPNYADIPPCRTAYAAANDSIAGCSMYTGVNDGAAIGWARDASTTLCWFARGNCCSALGGSALCSGEANGTRWARTWFR